MRLGFTENKFQCPVYRRFKNVTMSSQNFSASFVTGRAQQAINVNYVNLIAVTLLVYDTLLTLGDEILYIWRVKWTFIKCVYIASKYLAFVDGVLMLLFLFDTNLDHVTCFTLYSATTYVIIAGIVLAEIILLMRTCALWGLSRYILWYLILIDLAAVTVSVVKLRSSFHGNKLEFVPSPIPTIRPCFPVFQDTVVDNIYVDFICVMAIELNVLILTFWRGFLHWKRSTNPLIYVFYRDGVVYLVCLVAISATNVVFFLTQNTNFYWNVMLEPQRIVHAILAAHMIINVRRLGDRDRSIGTSLSGDTGSTPQPVSLEMKTMASTLASSIGMEL